MPLLCQKRGCGREATHALQFACGTFTDPDAAAPRCRINMDILLCAEHLDEADAGAFLEANPDVGRLAALAMGGGPPPDLARSVMLGVPIGSEEWTELQATKLRNGGH